MQKVNIHEAKTHLSKLLARVQQGEEIIISKADVPIARLISVNNRPSMRTAGSATGKIVIGADFDDPLPESIQEEFEA